MKKNSLTAFFLGFIPGMGHMYLRKFVRGFLYPFATLIIAMIGLMIGISAGTPVPFLLGLFIAFLIWVISLFDLVVTILKGKDAAESQGYPLFPISPESSAIPGYDGKMSAAPESASAATIALAFIPGLGHMHLGLVYRGLTFLIGFFGILTMVFFVTSLSNEEGFLIFLGALPILWVYNLFDAMQMYHRKNRGETLVDRTIFEELEDQRAAGKKSKVLAMFLSMLPGAGHMYLGLQRRGLQLMAAFLFSIYILDVLHLSLFLFLIPILWFFSFFDALQQVSRYESGGSKDVPIVEWLINHQRWVGIGLLALGAFYIVDQVAVPTLYRYIDDYRIRIWYDQYFQTTIVSLVLIIAGVKLLAGSKKKGGDGE